MGTGDPGDPVREWTPICPNCKAGCWDIKNSGWFKNPYWQEWRYSEANDFFFTLDEAVSNWNAFCAKINALDRPKLNLPLFLKKLEASNIRLTYDDNLKTILLKSKDHNALKVFHQFLADRPEYERALLATKGIPFFGLDERDKFYLKARAFMYLEIVPIFELDDDDLDPDYVKQKDFWLDLIKQTRKTEWGLPTLPAAVLMVQRKWQLQIARDKMKNAV